MLSRAVRRSNDERRRRRPNDSDAARTTNGTISASVDPASAKNDLAVVENSRLSRCDRELRCVEDDLGTAVAKRSNGGRRRLMTMANLDGRARGPVRLARDPVDT